MKSRKLPVLCSEDQCTGCSACVDACKFTAIKIQSDIKGFDVPVINNELCVGCLACQKACPVINAPKAEKLKGLRAYAAWNRNDDVRRVSSSGGLFTALAEAVLGENGYVWGAAFDDLQLSYKCVSDINDLDKLRRSKYIECSVGKAFNDIKCQLKEGKKVLFCGTPCHVRGLYKATESVDTTNLLLVDFICHGVPSQLTFDKYIEWLEDRKGYKIKNFTFRHKKYGVNNGISSLIHTEFGTDYVYRLEDSFMYGALENWSLRDSCHNCTSNGDNRVADITIADFWGIKNLKNSSLFKEKSKGISAVICSTIKGEEILQTLHGIVDFEEVKLADIIAGNSAYHEAPKRSNVTNVFWESFLKNNDWKDVLHLYNPSYKNFFVYFLIRFVSPRLADMLRYYIFK